MAENEGSTLAVFAHPENRLIEIEITGVGSIFLNADQAVTLVAGITEAFAVFAGVDPAIVDEVVAAPSGAALDEVFARYGV